MRAVVSIRFVATIAALLGLVVVLQFVLPSPTGAGDEIDGVVRRHRIDLIAPVERAVAAAGFTLDAQGRTTTDLALVLDTQRTMVIAAGTPGDILDCPASITAAPTPTSTTGPPDTATADTAVGSGEGDDPGTVSTAPSDTITDDTVTDESTPEDGELPPTPNIGCAVVVDLLGDAVLWFALVESTSTANVVLPATMELLDNGRVLLDNGWEVRHAAKVERRCPEDTASLRDFILRFGAEATSTFDVERQQVVRVTCPA